jgi:hypothetical protein
MKKSSRWLSRSNGLAAALCLLAAAAPALAQANDEEVSVTDSVVSDHHYSFGLNTSARAMQGSFDAYGAYHPFMPGSTAISLAWSLNASYRLSQVVEIGTSLPIRRSMEWFPTGTSASWMMNAPGIDTRFHLGGWPHLVAHVGFSGPWKWRDSNITGDPSASMPDDMGDGFVPGASMRLGLGVSRSFSRFRIALDVSGTHPFASTNVPMDAPPGVVVAPVTSQSGDRISFSEGASYSITHRWTANAGLRQYWAGPTIADGSVVEGTRGRAFTTSVGTSFIPSSSWRFNASVETQYPFYDYAVNLPYAPAVSVGMVYVGI